MADDDGIRLRNVSPFGAVDVPDLGLIVDFHHEIVVADETVAARLVESGHFTAVGRPGPKTLEPTEDTATGTSAPAVTPPADATTGAADHGENDQ